MIEAVNWDAVATGFGGCALSAALARSYITRSLRQLDEVATRVAGIKEQLAAVSVKLDAIDNQANLLTDHDRKIVAMEAAVYGGRFAKTRNINSYRP